MIGDGRDGVVLGVRLKVIGVSIGQESKLAPLLPAPSRAGVQRDTFDLELGPNDEARVGIARRAVNVVTTGLNVEVVCSVDPVPRMRQGNVVTVEVGVDTIIWLRPACGTIPSPEGVGKLSGLLLRIVQFGLGFPFDFGVVVPNAFGLFTVDGFVVVGLPHFTTSLEFGGRGVDRTDGRGRSVPIPNGIDFATGKGVPFAKVLPSSASASAADLPLVLVVDEVPSGRHSVQVAVSKRSLAGERSRDVARWLFNLVRFGIPGLDFEEGHSSEGVETKAST